MIRYLRGKGSISLEYNNDIIGELYYNNWYYTKYRKSTYSISSIIIKDEYRNNSFGSKLMNEFLTNLPNHMKMVTLLSNRAAYSFYEKNGFKLLNDRGRFIYFKERFDEEICNEVREIFP